MKRLKLIQRITLLCLLIFIVGVASKNHTKSVKQDEMQQTFEEKAEGVKDLTLGDQRAIKKSFGIDAAEYEWCMYYYAMDLMDVSEVLIVKKGTAEDQQQIKDGVESRIEKQKVNFDGYGTNQMQLLQEAKCIELGDYYFYAVSEHAADWEKVFKSVVK